MDATMLTQVIEHDHTEDTREYSLLHKLSGLLWCNRLITNFLTFKFLFIDGMQQFMVESEGGTVLIDCTNVTIVKADQTNNKP